MLGVLPQAGAFATQEEQAPLQKATALQTLGALPRNIQQAYDTALQQQWQQSQYQYPLDIAGLAAGQSQPPVYAQSGYSPSAAQSATSGIAPWLSLAMQAAMFSNPATAPVAAATMPMTMASMFR